MNKKIIIKTVLILLWAMNTCLSWERTTGCEGSKNSGNKQPVQMKADPVDTVLKQLNKKTSELKSYQAQIEYGFIQPLLESETLRKGVLYYAKLGKKSKLRANFVTFQQEDEEEDKYVVQYIVLDGGCLTLPGQRLEGMWFVEIDYEIETVKYIQLAEPHDPNKPVDAFDLTSRHFPMVGFSRIEDLKKQFVVTLVEQKKSEPKGFIQVHLKVKPTSTYKDRFLSIDFWIDKKLSLPAKIVAVTTEEEIYRIKFLRPKVNVKIDEKVFDFKIPEGFDEPEIMPLKKKGEQK